MAHAFEFLVIGVLVVGAAAAVAFLLARRYVRRRWHLVRGHPVTRGVLAAGAVVSAGREDPE